MSSSAYSGRWGLVNGVPSVRKWNATDAYSDVKAVASSTRHGTRRGKGINSWQGSYDAYGVSPAVLPGDVFDFVGCISPNDVTPTDLDVVKGTAIVDSVVCNWNWQTGEFLSHVVNFSGHGLLTEDTDAYSDATDLTAETSIENAKVMWKLPAGNYTEWLNLVSASLTLSCANQAVVNSSTAGATERRIGPALDIILSIVEQASTIGGPSAAGVDVCIKLYDSATTFWELEFMKTAGREGLTIDRETAAIVQSTRPLRWNCAMGATLGKVVTPALLSAWPPAEVGS